MQGRKVSEGIDERFQYSDVLGDFAALRLCVEFCFFAAESWYVFCEGQEP